MSYDLLHILELRTILLGALGELIEACRGDGRDRRRGAGSLKQNEQFCFKLSPNHPGKPRRRGRIPAMFLRGIG